MAAPRSKTLKILKEEGLGSAFGYKCKKLLAPILINLTWDLGFSMPNSYGFFYIASHATGHNGLRGFLQKCGVRMPRHFEEDGKVRYRDNCLSLLSGSGHSAICLSEIYFKDYQKYFSSLTKRVPALVLMRDPISILKSVVNFTYTNDDKMSVVWGGGGSA